MNIGKAIISIREHKGLTQVAFSKKTGLTQTTVSQLETGKKGAGKKTIAKIAKAFKIPPTIIYVMSLEGNDVPKDRRHLYDKLFPIIQELSLSVKRAPTKKRLKK